MLTAVLIIVLFSTSPPIIVLKPPTVNIYWKAAAAADPWPRSGSYVWRGAVFAGLRIVSRSITWKCSDDDDGLGFPTRRRVNLLRSNRTVRQIATRIFPELDRRDPQIGLKQRPPSPSPMSRVTPSVTSFGRFFILHERNYYLSGQ